MIFEAVLVIPIVFIVDLDSMIFVAFTIHCGDNVVFVIPLTIRYALFGIIYVTPLTCFFAPNTIILLVIRLPMFWLYNTVVLKTMAIIVIVFTIGFAVDYIIIVYEHLV